MPLNWQQLFEQMTPPQKLVHVSARYDVVDERRVQAALLGMRQKAYNDELTIQAQNAGCHGLTGRAGAAIIEQLDAVSKTDAASIANTFNYFLALEIIRAGERQPGASMEYYARAVVNWIPSYWAYKDAMIVTQTDGSARAKAQQDFYINNANVKGVAKLEPRSAVCPVCAGWITRGLVPLRVAMNNPPPYHPNCFPPYSIVNMPDGTAKQIDKIIEGEFVASRQGKTEVVRVMKRHTLEDLYCLYVDGQVLRLTGDHPVLTGRGWIPARELQVGDGVALVNSREPHLDDNSHKE